MAKLTEEETRAVCNQLRDIINSVTHLKEWEKLSPGSQIEVDKIIKLAYAAKDKLGNL